jgi:hypothetical protein
MKPKLPTGKQVHIGDEEADVARMLDLGVQGRQPDLSQADVDAEVIAMRVRLRLLHAPQSGPTAHIQHMLRMNEGAMLPVVQAVQAGRRDLIPALRTSQILALRAHGQQLRAPGQTG